VSWCWTSDATVDQRFACSTIDVYYTASLLPTRMRLISASLFALVVAQPAGALRHSPVAPPAAGCEHEPSGFTLINEQPWDVAPALGVRQSAGWIDDGGNGATALSIIDDAAAPAPGPNHHVVAGRFPAGQPGGTGPFYVYRPFAPREQVRSLFICLYVKHDSGFDNTNGNAGTKFLWIAGDQVQGALTYTSHEGPAMAFTVNQQGPVDRALGANVDAPAARLADRRGRWVLYELLLKASSSNATADGELHVWIGGVKTHQYTDVKWQMAASRKWLSLAWNPTYGGGLHPVPHDQYQYLDHVHISGAP
jgi:hypothetical protein